MVAPRRVVAMHAFDCDADVFGGRDADVMATFTAREPPSVDCRSNQRIHSIQPLAQRLFPPLQQDLRDGFLASSLVCFAFSTIAPQDPLVNRATMREAQKASSGPMFSNAALAASRGLRFSPRRQPEYPMAARAGSGSAPRLE
jgi:hypothetical protein